MTKIALIGSGSSSIGYMRGLIAELSKLTSDQRRQYQVRILEKSQIAGSGLPYDKHMVSPEHLFNVHTVSVSVPGVAMSDEPAEQARAIQERDEFFRYINSNKENLKKEFEEIFFKRFQRAFKRKFGAFNEADFQGVDIFSSGFQNTPFYQANQAKPGFLEMLDHHQKKFQNYVEKVEENIKNRNGFLPRIIYGFYSKALFDYHVNKLAGLIGAENITISTQTEVQALKKAEEQQLELDYKTLEMQETQAFDEVFVATGLWQEEPDQEKNPKFIQNIWPVEKVEDAIHAAVANAYLQGRPEIKIGVIGTSLSAIDMTRTAFEEGEKIDGVKIKVDLLSRNGRFQKVKGSFRWLISEWIKYFPQALEGVFEKYGIPKSEFTFNYNNPNLAQDQANSSKHYNDLSNQLKKVVAKITEQNKAKEGKDVLYLWQVLKLFMEISQETLKNVAAKEVDAARRQALLEKLRYYEETAKFVEENKDNYERIIDKLFETQDKDPFIQLRRDLEISTVGDTKDGEYIFENVYGFFIDALDTTKLMPSGERVSLLPADERIFRKIFSRSLVGQINAGMPPESAEYFLELHKKGILNAKDLGYDAKIERDAAPRVTDSHGNSQTYDLMIDTSRANVKKTTKSPLLKSLLEQGLLSTSPIKAEDLDVEYIHSKAAQTKYGKYLAEIHKTKQQGSAEGEIVFDDNVIDKSNFSPKNQPNLTIHLGVWGINGSMNSAKTAAESMVKRNEAKRVEAAQEVPAAAQVVVGNGAALDGNAAKRANTLQT